MAWGGGGGADVCWPICVCLPACVPVHWFLHNFSFFLYPPPLPPPPPFASCSSNPMGLMGCLNPRTN